MVSLSIGIRCQTYSHPGTQNDSIQCFIMMARFNFIPDKDMDNEDIVMLPDNLFIQLLDVDLQRRIANTNDHDEEVTRVLTTMLEQGPPTLCWELGDWTIEKFEG